MNCRSAPLASCQWAAGLKTYGDESIPMIVIVKPAFHRHEADGDEVAGWRRSSFQTSIPPVYIFLSVIFLSHLLCN